MVIDASALIAILLGEPPARALAQAIAADPVRLLCTVSALETHIVITAKKGEPGARQLDLLVHRARIEPVAQSVDQLDLARKGWEAYGKGRHPASLNLGDCCAYALAKHAGQPLLFVGANFSKTDVARVGWHLSGLEGCG